MWRSKPELMDKSVVDRHRNFRVDTQGTSFTRRMMKFYSPGSDGRIVKFTADESMAEQLTDADRKRIATGPDRGLAAAVIVPRMLGAVQHHGQLSSLRDSSVFVGRQQISVLASLYECCSRLLYQRLLGGGCDVKALPSEAA